MASKSTKACILRVLCMFHSGSLNTYKERERLKTYKILIELGETRFPVVVEDQDSFYHCGLNKRLLD